MAIPLWIAVGAGSCLLVPASVYFVQCATAALGGSLPAQPLGRRPSLCVMVPAHNEAKCIQDTLESLKPQLAPGDRLLVIADNCTDDTAQLARAAGAMVLERSSESDRGKGFAISFGLEHLASDPPEVLVLVDADCMLSSDAIDTIGRLALSEQRPVQAEYLLTAPESPSPLSAISALAFLVRNRVRPLGMAKLGFPCHLTGSGMAFPWELIKNSPALGDNLVEDLVMGLDMALAGKSPLFCPSARVRSVLPERTGAAASQRTRWEHGQLATLVSRGPKLLAAALRQNRPELAALALDLMVPPLALLTVSLAGTTLASGMVGALVRKPLLALIPASTGLGLVGLGTVLAWSRFARDTVPLKVLLMAPVYVGWKLPMYVSLLVRGRQKTWVRTERDATPSGSTAPSGKTGPVNGSNGSRQRPVYS